METIKTYFRLLEVNLVWDNYLEYVDTHRTSRCRDDHYFEKMFEVITFKDWNNTVFFNKSKNKPSDEQQIINNNGTDKYFYDDRKYALAVLLLAHIQ